MKGNRPIRRPEGLKDGEGRNPISFSGFGRGWYHAVRAFVGGWEWVKLLGVRGNIPHPASPFLRH